MRYLIFALFGILLGCELGASIVNTKHNLSISGTGTVKATAEAEICVFCHVPHFAQEVGKPLWNRSMPATDYVMYDSEYLRRMGYPSIAADLGSANDTPGALSRQCLSCHDGTIAIGAVSKLRRNQAPDTIDMSGVDPDGTIIDTASTFIGTDLSHHHPVGAPYDSTISKAFGVGTRTSELKATPDSPVKLFEYPSYSGGYVECSSCHDPHKDNKMFLHYDSGANHAQNFAGTCTSCHEKSTFDGSVHQSPPGTPAYTDVDLIAKYGTGDVGELACANCHVPHNGQGVGYLNRQVLEQTCFQGAASSEAGAACHGVGGAKDIKSILSRTYTHPVLAEDNLPGTQHTNLDALYGTGNADPLGYDGMDWATNKHAVCMDCHNPHRARAGTHIVDGSWYGAPGASTNLVSNVLLGVPGIEPTWPSSWTQPTTFTTMESAEKEYQICFKCHSYWGIGSATWGINDGGYVSPSDGVTPLTDVAWEMNINNKSGHPVVINQLARTGSYAPKELDTTQLWTPWKENPGLNTMYCSDCHGADDELGGDPKGPHGSNLKYILKGANQYWPLKPDGVTLYTMDDLKNNTDQGLFCANCHDPDRPHTDWWNKMANRGLQCVQCHVTVPHGSPVSRLIGYRGWPLPYNYGGNKLAMEGYRKNTFTQVDQNDVYAPSDAACSGMGCHGTDDSANGAYDANPYP